jgi:pyruvate/2-oxoglutarate dehydrogenase complex dihydrolipoamide dehydrogenase (E3) component
MEVMAMATEGMTTEGMATGETKMVTEAAEMLTGTEMVAEMATEMAAEMAAAQPNSSYYS